MALPQAGGSAARHLEDAAQEVAPWIIVLARVGYLAKALLYATIGVLAAKAALGNGGRTTDLGGALREVVRAPFGNALLFVIAAGLAGYAVWRVVDAATDAEGRGGDMKGVARRIAIAFNGLVHGALALAAVRLATGSRDAGGERSEELAGRALDLPLGQWLVWLAALAVIGFGLYQVYRGYASKLGRQLDLGGLPAGTFRWVIGLSRFGIAARGVVFGLIGILLVRAASGQDAEQAGGTEESLQMLAGMGRWPLAVVAVGLVAYGLYEVLNARYRRIRVT